MSERVHWSIRTFPFHDYKKHRVTQLPYVRSSECVDDLNSYILHREMALPHCWEGPFKQSKIVIDIHGLTSHRAPKTLATPLPLPTVVTVSCETRRTIIVHSIIPRHTSRSQVEHFLLNRFSNDSSNRQVQRKIQDKSSWRSSRSRFETPPTDNRPTRVQSLVTLRWLLLELLP